MAPQDNITLASQQFANQVGERRDRIAEKQIDLNLQAGQMSGQVMDQWRRQGAYKAQMQAQQMEQQLQMADQARQQGRYQAEMAGDAVNLAKDQLELNQAAEELAWARQLRQDKMLKNALLRDQANTDLAVAQAEEARRKIAATENYGRTTLDSAIEAKAGMRRVFSHETGRFEYKPATEEEKQLGSSYIQTQMDMLQAKASSRYGRAQPGVMDDSKVAQTVKDLMEVSPKAAMQVWNENQKRKGLPLATPKDFGIEDESQTTAKDAVSSASETPDRVIQSIGPGNTTRARELFSRPEIADALKKAYTRDIPSDRLGGLDTSPKAMVEKALDILDNPGDPRRDSLIQLLQKMNLIDQKEMSDWMARSGVTNLDVSRFVGSQPSGQR